MYVRRYSTHIGTHTHIYMYECTWDMLLFFSVHYIIVGACGKRIETKTTALRVHTDSAAAAAAAATTAAAA